jgi:hypothetical protein
MAKVLRILSTLLKKQTKNLRHNRLFRMYLESHGSRHNNDRNRSPKYFLKDAPLRSSWEDNDEN